MVCGFGQVGYRVVTLLLDLGEKVTVITLSGRDEWIRRVSDRGARIYTGDARDEAFLDECGLRDAKAIIACTDDDGANIEIALDARRLHPKIRVVARLFDTNLARQAEFHLGVDAAIEMSGAAAPAFAAAAFGDRVLAELTAGTDRLLLLRLDGPQTIPSTPLVLVTPTGVHTRDVANEIGEGESAVVTARAESASEGETSAHRRRAVLDAINPIAAWRVAAGIWSNSSRPLRATVVLINAIILVSVIVFRFGMNLSLTDAFYFVITTVTTTGYGDISPRDASSWLKLYTCMMMLLGAAGMAVLFSMVTDYIVTSRLMQLAGRQRMPDTGHVVVVGIGSVGYRTIDELVRLGVQVVAVDGSEDGDYVNSLRSRVPLVIGDAREEDTLRRAGVANARTVIATSPSDTVNLSVGLAAKALNPRIRLVLRIFDAEFATKVQSVSQVDAALSATRLAAPAFVGAALHAKAVASFRLGPHFFILCEDALGEITVGGIRMSLQTMDLSEAPTSGSL